MSTLIALLIGVLVLVYWRAALVLAVAVVIALIILGMMTALKAGHGSLHLAHGLGHQVFVLARAI